MIRATGCGAEWQGYLPAARGGPNRPLLGALAALSPTHRGFKALPTRKLTARLDRSILAPMLVTRAECVTCGAPIGFSDGQRVVICAYCNTSLRIEVPRDSAQGPAGAPQPVSASGISPEEIGRVKQMAIEGKR